jgi:Sulfotransferase domain
MMMMFLGFVSLVLLIFLLLLQAFHQVHSTAITSIAQREGIPALLPRAETNNRMDSDTRPKIQQQQSDWECLKELPTLPAVPHFILAGTQKGGTSALRNMLVQHPQMIASQKFEPHFFDSKLRRYLQKTYLVEDDNEPLSTIFKPEWTCNIQRHYIQSTFHKEILAQQVINNHTGYLFYEKTPSYLVDPDIPALIRQICPWKPKIVVILRDPIERAFSHYKMEREKLRVKLNFTTIVNQEIARFQTLGLTHAPLITPGDDSSRQWLLSKDKDDDDNTLFSIPKMSHTAMIHLHYQLAKNYSDTNFLQRGMYAVQLPAWMKHFPLGESLLVLQLEDLQADPAKVYRRLLQFLGARHFELKDEDLLKTYRTRGQYRRKGMIHPPMANETRVFLQKFFRPYNELLSSLLGEDYYTTTQ